MPSHRSRSRAELPSAHFWNTFFFSGLICPVEWIWPFLSCCSSWRHMRDWLGEKHCRFGLAWDWISLLRGNVNERKCLRTFVATETNSKGFEMRCTARPSVSRVQYNKTSHFPRDALHVCYFNLDLMSSVLHNTPSLCNISTAEL